jgi:hypothetical protein
VRLLLRPSIHPIMEKGIELLPVALAFIGGGISAIHSGFAGSGRGYKREDYPVAERDGRLVSFQLHVELCLPCGDYRLYRR